MKYDVVIFLFKGTSIPQDSTINDVQYLIAIRNKLIHFIPEWDNDFKYFTKLENDRKDRFTDSPFFSKENHFFPYRCLSASCASWALKTVHSFSKIFESHVCCNYNNFFKLRMIYNKSAKVTHCFIPM